MKRQWGLLGFEVLEQCRRLETSLAKLQHHPDLTALRNSFALVVFQTNCSSPGKLIEMRRVPGRLFSRREGRQLATGIDDKFTQNAPTPAGALQLPSGLGAVHT